MGAAMNTKEAYRGLLAADHIAWTNRMARRYRLRSSRGPRLASVPTGTPIHAGTVNYLTEAEDGSQYTECRVLHQTALPYISPRVSSSVERGRFP